MWSPFDNYNTVMTNVIFFHFNSLSLPWNHLAPPWGGPLPALKTSAWCSDIYITYLHLSLLLCCLLMVFGSNTATQSFSQVVKRDSSLCSNMMSWCWCFWGDTEVPGRLCLDRVPTRNYSLWNTHSSMSQINKPLGQLSKFKTQSGACSQSHFEKWCLFSKAEDI